MRNPSFATLQALETMCKGKLLGDVVAVIGSIDIVLGEIDRYRLAARPFSARCIQAETEEHGWQTRQIPKTEDLGKQLAEQMQGKLDADEAHRLATERTRTTTRPVLTVLETKLKAARRASTTWRRRRTS